LKYLQTIWCGGNGEQDFEMEIVYFYKLKRYFVKQNFAGQDFQSPNFIIDENMTFST